MSNTTTSVAFDRDVGSRKISSRCTSSSFGSVFVGWHFFDCILLFVTVDDSNGCTWDGEDGDVLATTGDGVVCTECDWYGIVVVADGAYLLFLEDGKDGDVFVTVDDCNGCAWDGENGDEIAPRGDGVGDDLLVNRLIINRWHYPFKPFSKEEITIKN